MPETEHSKEAGARKNETLEERQKRFKLKKEREELHLSNSEAKVRISRQELQKNKASLKSDVKRTTGFVKKCKSVSEDTAQNLLIDVEKLNLTRYVSEVVAALLEAPIKSKDCFALTKVISAIHQRYDEFTWPILEAIENEFLESTNPKVDPDKGSISRARVLLRLSCELVLCGVVDNPVYCMKMVRRLCRAGMKPPVEEKNAIPLSNHAFAHHQAIIQFVKNYGDEFLQLRGDDISSVISDQLRERCQNLVSEYFESLCSRLVKESKALNRRKARNKEELVSRGSLSKRSAELLDSHVNSLNRFLAVTETLAELLQKEIPVLDQEEKEEEETKESGGIALWDRRKEGEGNEEETLEQFIYGGEENRAFYCDLLDLQAMLPGGLIGDDSAPSSTVTEQKLSQKNVNQVSNISNTKGTLDEALGQLGVRVNAQQSPSSTNQEKLDYDGTEKEKSSEKSLIEKKQSLQETSRKKVVNQKSKIDVNEYEEEYDIDDDDYDFDMKPDKLSVSREIQELLLTLPNCLSRTAVDKFAVEFCHLNSKQARTALTRELRYIPWNRTELIPYYARIVATLSQLYDDIGPKLVNRLIRQFRYLSKTTSMNKLDQRLRNARYIGEMVKFNLEKIGAPPEKAFYVLNTCFKNFTGSNVNYACELLETCGRYLYRNPETHSDTAKALDTLWRYRKQLNLSHTLNTAIENAYYFSKSTEQETKLVKRKVKSNVEKYFEYLVFEYLGSDGFEEMSGSGDADSKVEEENKKKIEVYSEKERIKTKRKQLWCQCDFVMQQFLRLDWGSSFDASANLFIKLLLKSYKLRSETLPLVCRIAVDLCNYYPKLGTRLVDTLLERIELDLERNDYRYQQKRLGHARLFAELYNSRIIDNVTFFDTLYMMIHHGHSVPWPEHQRYQPESKEDEARHNEMITFERERKPRGPNYGGCKQDDTMNFDPSIEYESDPADDSFRIRLVCETLNQCGVFVRFGSIAKRMDRFWAYLEQFAFTKTSNLLFSQHLLNDTLQNLKSIRGVKKVSLRQEKKNIAMVQEALRRRPKNFEEARQRVKELERKSASGSAAEQQEQDEDIDDEETEEVEENFEYDEANEEEEYESDDEEEDESNDDEYPDYLEAEEDESIEEDDIADDTFDAEEEAEAEKEFEKEFAQMMQLNQQHMGTLPAKSSQNMAIPRHFLKKLDSQDGDIKNEPETVANKMGTNGVKFQLLKRGVKGKIEAKPMVIPEETMIAQATKKDVDAEKKEHELMKSFVLQYEEREHHARLEETRNQVKNLFKPSNEGNNA